MVRKRKDEIGGGAPAEETSPAAEPETTPAPEAKEETTTGAEETLTLTKKEHDDLLRQAKAAAELGRTLKVTLGAHTTLKQQFDAQVQKQTEFENQIKELRQKERDRELRAVDGKPDLIDAVRTKHEAEDKIAEAQHIRSEVDRERSQYQTELDEAAKLRAERKAEELAKESGLSADTLFQIASDTDEKSGRVTFNLKRMESVAKSVPKGEGEDTEDEADGESTNAVKGQRSRAPGAQNRSATRGLQTMQDYDTAYGRGEISAEEYAKARNRFGVAY